MLSDDDLTQAGVLAEYLDELQRERDFSNDLATDLESVRLVLSEALALIQRQTLRIERQSDRIRELMGLVQTGEGWHPAVRLVDQPDGDVSPRMTLASDIRWAPRG